MKKLLIASTALVATASVAAAEINMSGYGRFGIQYDDDRTSLTSGRSLENTRLESRYRLNIDGVATTDGGVRFAVRVRGQSDEDSKGRVTSFGFSAPRLQVGVGGFRVRVGNISGVTDASETINWFGIEPGLVGKTGMYATHGGQVLGGYDAYSSGSCGSCNNTGINVKYEAGDFAIMGSWIPDYDQFRVKSKPDLDRMTWEVGASYTFSGWTLGGVYGHGDYNGDGGSNSGINNLDYNWWAVSLTGAVGAADIVAFVGGSNIDEDTSDLANAFGYDFDTVEDYWGTKYDDRIAYGLSAAYPIGAATDITGSIAAGGDKDLKIAFGVGVDHSLGGGVNLKGMAGQNAYGDTIADFGVIFNF